MSSDNIYTLTSEYKNEVATETNASLRSCELLYQIKEAALQRAPSENSKEYKKQIAAIRKECGLSKSQFNKDVAVGATLQRVASNEIRSMKKTDIYKQYCTTPRTPKPKTEKIDYKSLVEFIQNMAGEKAWNNILKKYNCRDTQT
jgi:DNA-binding transcriptional regulator YiaG